MISNKYRGKPERFRIIDFVEQQGSVSRAQIAEQMQKTIPEISQTLKELEGKSLEIRVHHEDRNLDRFSIPKDNKRIDLNELY